MYDNPGAPFRADHVGSLLRPPELHEARARAARGEIDRAALRAVEDRSIRAAVALQESVGLQSVTDGEFRRDWWHIDFIRGFDGVETSTQSFGVKFQGADEQPPLMKVTGRIRRTRPSMLDHFTFLKSATTRTATPASVTSGSTCATFALPSSCSLRTATTSRRRNRP